MTERTGFSVRSAGLIVLGAIIGVVGLSALRFAGQPPHEHVHYHANWAIFVDSERLDLTDDWYMEDVFQCLADPSQQRAEDRAHMHENNQDVVHVHASGVSWDHLLANLGFGVGDDYLETDRERLEEDDQNSVKFVLNGRPVSSIRNLPIGDEDRLLISYGTQTIKEVMESEFPVVEKSAGEYNVLPDPASCSGQQAETLGERIRRAVWY
ncbi:MAG: hypothetical protein GEU90_05230 [Gemmatimonas sp.]|nr:hypothetical protein [Gemmatimonas sp.]